MKKNNDALFNAPILFEDRHNITQEVIDAAKAEFFKNGGKIEKLPYIDVPVDDSWILFGVLLGEYES
jgi:hypothetical protein